MPGAYFSMFVGVRDGAVIRGNVMRPVGLSAGWAVSDSGREWVSGPGLRLGVLGPLAGSCDGTPLDLGDGRQRAVLGLLALHANTLVDRDRIIDAVWGERPPASAVNLVQGCVSRLRRIPCLSGRGQDGRGGLTSDGRGYELRVTAGQLDVLAFRDFVDRAGAALSSGDAGPAGELLDAALGLWRGEPLMGIDRLRGHPALAGVRRERAAAVLIYAEAGPHDRVLPALWALARDEPLNERAHACLMIALAATGQQAEALRVFGELRVRLDSELGLRPGAELASAHLRVLRQHPAGGGVVTAARQLPAAAAHFVGRTAELETLTALLGDTATTAAIAVISGAPGVGKTTLAVRWAHQIADQFPDGQLYVNLRGFDPSGQPVPAAAAVRGFLDAFQVPAERIPAGLPAQAALYRSLLAGRRVLTVLDNARDAAQVRPLLPGTAGCLTVVTSRSRLPGLMAGHGARPVGLQPLSDGEAADLLARSIGAERVVDNPAAAHELIEWCARLPLAISIAAARAAIRPSVPLAVLAAELRDVRTRLDFLDTRDVDGSLRTVYSWSCEQLSAPAARMFRLLGLHPGPDVSLPAAASMAGMTVREARSVLEELMLSSLLAEDRPGRYSLHDLLRVYAAEQAVAQESEEDRRAAVHRLLDHYLISSYSAALVQDPRREPLTLPALRPDVVPERIADRGEALTWHETEYPVLTGAMALADTYRFDVHAWQIYWCMVGSFSRHVRPEEWRSAALIALSAADRAGDRYGRALAQHGLGAADTAMGAYDDADTHYAAALGIYQEMGDLMRQARVNLDLGLSYELRERHHDVFGAIPEQPCRQHDAHVHAALSHARQAQELFRAVGHRAGEAAALGAVGRSLALSGRPGEAVDYCERAVRASHELGDRNAEAIALVSLGYALHKASRYADAAAACQRGLDLCPSTGSLRVEAMLLTHLAEAHKAAGNIRPARAAWEQALVILDNLHLPDADQVRARLQDTETTG
jgi:DNA-binding SARP family transcriptional activator/tetratricopeptide (TPR) repeat protein